MSDELDSRIRFLKVFTGVNELAKDWFATFVRGRIPQKFNLLEDYINSEVDILNNKMVKVALDNFKAKNPNTTIKIRDLDISSLNAIVLNGKLLHMPHEKKSFKHLKNTKGDIIDRLRTKRNEFAHSGEPQMDETDYKDSLDDLKDIATHFESMNKTKSGDYVSQVEKIEREHWTEKTVEVKIEVYQVFIEYVIKIEVGSMVGILKDIVELSHAADRYVPRTAQSFDQTGNTGANVIDAVAHNFLDVIPVVGHVKAVIHEKEGDNYHARKSMKTVTRSTAALSGALAGFAIGGPIGAAVGFFTAGVAADGVHSAVN